MFIVYIFIIVIVYKLLRETRESFITDTPIFPTELLFKKKQNAKIKNIQQ